MNDHADTLRELRDHFAPESDFDKAVIAALDAVIATFDRQTRTVDEAFAVAMQGHHYGREETDNARHWFKAGFNAAPTGQGDVERLVEDDEDEDCPHCVNGIVPMTMNRPCSHCTPILHTSPLGQQQEGQG